jgi:hypothetical protein
VALDVFNQAAHFLTHHFLIIKTGLCISSDFVSHSVAKLQWFSGNCTPPTGVQGSHNYLQGQELLTQWP